jgi:hypothetical protein
MTTALTVRDETTAPLPSGGESSVFASHDGFELAQRAAKALASSDLVPQQFKGNVANCLLALETAARVRVSPLAVMQNLYVVQGKPMWSAQFVIAAVNASGRFSPLRFRAIPDGNGGVIAWARDLSDGEVLEGPPVTMKMAEAEGWLGKAGSKWKTMPELMLRYRAAAFFGRLYAPDILSGMRVVEESPEATHAPMTDERPLTGGRGNDGNVAMARTPLNDPYGALPAPAPATISDSATAPVSAHTSVSGDQSSTASGAEPQLFEPEPAKRRTRMDAEA